VLWKLHLVRKCVIVGGETRKVSRVWVAISKMWFHGRWQTICSSFALNAVSSLRHIRSVVTVMHNIHGGHLDITTPDCSVRHIADYNTIREALCCFQSRENHVLFGDVWYLSSLGQAFITSLNTIDSDNLGSRNAALGNNNNALMTVDRTCDTRVLYKYFDRRETYHSIGMTAGDMPKSASIRRHKSRYISSISHISCCRHISE
jgi:hypothetical protein